MLVMIPREPDLKVRRDGRIPARINAEAGALITVNERGHMHGASRINPLQPQISNRRKLPNQPTGDQHAIAKTIAEFCP